MNRWKSRASTSRLPTKSRLSVSPPWSSTTGSPAPATRYQICAWLKSAQSSIPILRHRLGQRSLRPRARHGLEVKMAVDPLLVAPNALGRLVIEADRAAQADSAVSNRSARGTSHDPCQHPRHDAVAEHSDTGC